MRTDITESILAVPQKPSYRIKLIRFKDWSVQNGVFLLGTFFADNLLAQSLGVIVASVVLACLCLAYGYALNEFHDDLQEKLADDPRTARELYQFIYILLTMALVLSFFLSRMTFAMVALIGVTVWFHSSPPYRLKRRLFWRLFLNSLGFGLFFLTGASLNNHLSTAEILMGIFIFGLYLPLELIHVLAHMEADQAKGLSTFAHVHGQKKTIALAIALLGGLILYSMIICGLGFASVAASVWSIFHLTLLAVALMSFYRRDHSVETYTKLRLRTKIVCAFYGMGLLALLVWKF